MRFCSVLTAPVRQAGRLAPTLAAALVLALVLALPRPAAAENRTAIFAGGCFWCVEADFDKVPGVLDTVSGFTGGHTENPTYEQVTYEKTGHFEAVRVTYDPATVTYRALVDYFFRHVDPTDAGGQFCDRGDSYRTAIFVDGPEARADAEAAKAAASEAIKQPIVTPILEAGPFYEAESYHQNYYETHALRYEYYRWRCGRDARIEEVWKGAKPAS
ncbi:peptide-methionine (S)-S-oxide reductase MsrA [Acuticoccus kandeliae]|uniref:peptide-methionine (S)-S-oxide reductase MsrA n=1 Tax=Acuticoccus kandeliae TaxID=2073160 RepID=UPI000D3E8EF4|nr:peptide-methionine (S)-S-oxide reductase MsrA [Acuticoccus kandeliae]